MEKNYKIDLEIYIVFIILIGVSVFNAIYSSIKITRNQDISNHIMMVDVPSIQALEQMNLLVTRSKMFTTNWVYLQSNKEDKEKLRILHNVDYKLLSNTIDNLKVKWNNQAFIDSVTSTTRRFEELMVAQRQVMSLLVHFEDYNDPMKKFEAEEIVESEIIPKGNAIIASLNSIIAEKKALADKVHAEMRASYRTLMWSVSGLAIIIIIVVLLASFYLSRSMIFPLMKLKEALVMLGRGTIPELNTRTRSNATGLMTEAVRNLIESIRKTTQFANAIGEGRYDIKYTPLSSDDELGLALIQMRTSLLKAAEDNNLRNWDAKGTEIIADVLRKNTDNIEQLYQEIIYSIVKYTNSLQGAFYISEFDNTYRETITYLKASCGIDNIVEHKKIFRNGEGLVGQAIKDGCVVHLNGAPNDFIKISSGLGSANASHILIVPIFYRNQIFGAIELAAFDPFHQHEINFLENIGDAITTTIASVKANLTTKELLEETRKQAIKLKQQEENLINVNQSLYKQQELIQESEERLKLSNEQLHIKASELEEQNSSLERIQQQLIEKATELEQSNKYKSEFLANMSHELRTPLNSILILAKLIADNKSGAVSIKEQEYAKVIHKSGNDLLTLINDILDLSKMEAGKIELIMEPTSFESIKSNIFSLFNEYAKSKGIHFDASLHDSLPSHFVTDAFRLEQVIKNLLSNALKFTPEDGHVLFSVRSAPSSISFTTENLRNAKQVVEFSVRDSGIGIAPDKQLAIFEAFQQADGSINRKFGGTGLGLSISKMLVTVLGGELKLSSEVNKGSTFYIYLPLEEAGVDISVKPDNSTVISGHIEVQTPTLSCNLSIENNVLSKFIEDRLLDFSINIVTKDDAIFTISDTENSSSNTIHVDEMMPEQSKPLDILNKGNIASYLNHFESKHLQRPMRILLVEDDLVQVKLFHYAIKTLPFAVNIATANSFDETLTLLEQDAYDLLVLDLDLGHGVRDGIDNIYKLKANSFIRDTQIVIYTVHELSNDEIAEIKSFELDINSKLHTTFAQLLTKVIAKTTSQGLLKLSTHKKLLVEAFNGKRILVVDDDLRNIFSLKAIFSEYQVKLFTAASGKQALEMSVSQSFDLVLSDLMMPQMNGYEFLENFKKIETCKNIPVYALTADMSIGVSNKCYEAGFVKCLLKPIDSEALINEILSTLYTA